MNRPNPWWYSLSPLRFLKRKTKVPEGYTLMRFDDAIKLWCIASLARRSVEDPTYAGRTEAQILLRREFGILPKSGEEIQA